MLIYMLREIDVRDIFDRSNGKTTFVLLDGHSSRTELEFIEDANDPRHKWTVCIGTPYGTSLWKVWVFFCAKRCFQHGNDVGKDRTC